MTEVAVRLVEGEERDIALKLEMKIFLEEGYPYDYHIYDDQSRVFAAFIDGVCVGALRLIAQSPLLPPSLVDCDVWDLEKWTSMGEMFEELATQAVEAEYRHKNIGFELIRAAYTDGRIRGVTAMSIITEPENIQFLTENAGFVCHQIGEIGFKGWDCAPYVQIMDEVEVGQAATHPEVYAWFTESVPERLLAAPRPVV